MADTDATQSGADILLELETTVKNYITDLDRKKSEIKKQREMLESALQNDETYRLHAEEAKKAAQQKSKTKFQIMQLPANKSLADKVKDLAVEIKEADGALSDYLREYQRLSGSTEIETNEGEVREIVYVAKLVKKSSR
ncbi:hypothetical protein A2363_00770 [Candidatus Gottesmanbacteria bacterium RIFOXYB1_FULL_47_11]|uniref:Uncharacterized protein n=1 Tax=Candidatus Gottesmanbacteria bacterium RIFOXYB1_FULL_47_11 TaxID=1798401 RepID=A0A1F6BGR1_9BACT|nr:MAG: hypothetical protein A2363_00770 [Candidatus Gottesmanbacteria bacterium RIFOXYB1_FULL_47_11]